MDRFAFGAAALDGLRDETVLLLAAFRLGAHPVQSESTLALADVLRAAVAHEVRLAGLSDDGVARTATAMGHQLAHSELDALLARAGGNPIRRRPRRIHDITGEGGPRSGMAR
jgi:hypothetical protein